ncbi:MAG: SBBP repeat-containing protein, partial [Thermoplasmata archaeon]|nr:SBBP repeat-containing protein [Thermoplasmata archaeon]
MILNRPICIVMAIAVILSANAGAHPFSFTTSRTTQCADTPLDVDLQDRFSSSSGFTENLGQFGDPSVLFYASGSHGSIAFQERGILLNIEGPTSGERKRPAEESNWDGGAPFPNLRSSRGPVIYSSTVRLSFSGADEVAPEGRARLHGYRNYFLGDDPTRWATHVPSYREVVYRDLYQGIDLVYREEGQRIKYEYIVHPGADPSRIITSVEGHDSLQVADGNLVISTKAGEIIDSGLDVFYLDGHEEKVACEFELVNPDTYGFRFSHYNRSRTLVIDPFVYSTLIGKISNEEGLSVAVDDNGSAYLTGLTGSITFPTTPGAYQLSGGGNEVSGFVTKFTPSGDDIVYSTFIGGTGRDIPQSISVDDEGNAYVGGYTNSTDFPTTNGSLQEIYAGGEIDSFVFKLDTTGGSLIYSTYFGSDGYARIETLEIDDSGFVYGGGITLSPNITATPGAYQTSYGGGYSDAFVFKLHPNGSALVFSTFLGGNESDRCKGIDIDDNGDVYVCGQTKSDDY